MEEQVKARVKMVLLVHILTDAFVLQRPSHESHSLKREQRYSSARKGLCEPVRNRKTKWWVLSPSLRVRAGEIADLALGGVGGKDLAQAGSQGLQDPTYRHLWERLRTTLTMNVAWGCGVSPAPLPATHPAVEPGVSLGQPVERHPHYHCQSKVWIWTDNTLQDSKTVRRVTQHSEKRRKQWNEPESRSPPRWEGIIQVFWKGEHVHCYPSKRRAENDERWQITSKAETDLAG